MTDFTKKWFPLHIVIPVLGAAIEVLAIASLAFIMCCAYGTGQCMPEHLVLPLTNAVLVIGGITGNLLGAAGVYLLLARARWWISSALVVLVCIPCIFCGALFSYAFLVFNCLV